MSLQRNAVVIVAALACMCLLVTAGIGFAQEPAAPPDSQPDTSAPATDAAPTQAADAEVDAEASADGDAAEVPDANPPAEEEAAPQTQQPPEPVPELPAGATAPEDELEKAAPSPVPAPEATVEPTPQTTPQTTPEPEAPVDASAPASEDEDEALEKPRPAQGYYIALAVLGVGAMAYDTDRGTRPPSFGTGYVFGLGQAITPWFDFGVGVSVYSTDGDDRMILGGLMFNTRLHLGERLFMLASMGAGGVGGPDPDDPEYDRGTYTTLYRAGIGGNLFLGDRGQSGGWLLSPIATLDVVPDSEFTGVAIGVGVELSWWSGLSRDQLDLPIDEAYAPKEDD